MGYPVGGGAANYSATGANNTSKFIPQVFSGKLLEKFYNNSIYQDICQTDYEGEIKSSGDEVIIRTVPTLSVWQYTKGVELNSEMPESPNVSLKIDRGFYTNFMLHNIDRVQSDLNLMDDWGNDASEQLKLEVNKDVLQTVYANAAADNAGATAGAKSGDINLGTFGAPLSLTKGNVIDFIVDCGTVLDEQNRPESGRYLVLPPKLCGLIKKSELKDASVTGDGKSTLRTGRLGDIDNFTLYRNNDLSVTSGKYDLIAGHKSAITFAGQITESDKVKAEKHFGEYARMLFVYGFEVVQPESLIHAVAQAG